MTGEAVITPTGARSPRRLVEALANRWLPEVLRRKGYATFAASGNPWVGEEVGLMLGFEKAYASWKDAGLPKAAGPWARPSRRGVGRRVRAARIYARRALGLGDGGAARSLEAFDSFLRGLRRGVRPFFAFFNVMEPHAPYAPPRGHNPLGFADRVAALRAVRKWNADRMLRYCVGQVEIDSTELDLLRSLYRGECSYTDAWLGRLVEGLDAAHLLEETLVIVTADHGENLGEHHLLAHVTSMHETLLHVPLAIVGPGVPAAVDARPVGLSSLARTIEANVDGSWIDPAQGPAIAEYESAAAHISAVRRLEQQIGEVPADVHDRLAARWIAVYEDNFKLIMGSNGEERLHDLEADPFEDRNVAAEHPEVVTRLRAAGTWDGFPGIEPKDEGATTDEEVLDAEITAHLESLGYL